ncbi:hypothetical protein [Rossellomorea marisflavi]|uniref:hypothetical protein n=1 Tax=Rossellomorea marisflavi TaxID=189381 RepID=UPI003F9FE912
MSNLDSVWMVRNTKMGDNQEETIHGAFRSHRDASLWLIESEGFEVGFDDHLSEFYEEETISFTKDVNGSHVEKAVVEEYLIHTIE